MLSWLSYRECVGGRVTPRDGRRNGDDDDGCPPPYESHVAYSEGNTVSRDGTIYRCKACPSCYQWCRQFPPDYEVHASQVVHRTGDSLGWEAIGSCGPRKGGAGRVQTTIRGGIVKSGNRDVGGRSKIKNGNKDKDKGKKNNKEKNNNKGKDKNKGKNKGKNKIQKRQSSQGQRVVVLGATDDIYVDSRDPNDGYDDTTLQYDFKYVQSLVRFDLSSLYEGGPCVLERAVLRLYPLQKCRGGTVVQVVVTPTGDDVDWSGVTWSTAPQKAGPKSAQPLIDRSLRDKGEWFEVDVTRAVQWSARVRREVHVVFRLRAASEDGSCVLASAERGGGADGPTLELHGRPPAQGGGQRRPPRPEDKRRSKRPRPSNRPRDRSKRDDSEDSAFARARGEGGVYTDGILLQREGQPCDIERYLKGANECVYNLVCYHPNGAKSGFGTCRKIGKLADRDDRCDASFGKSACSDTECECLGEDGKRLGRGGTRTGVCQVPQGSVVVSTVLRGQPDTKAEGELCQIERYLDGEKVCAGDMVCYEPNFLLSGLGICTSVSKSSGWDRLCYTSFGASACVDGLVCYEHNGLLSGLGICTRPIEYTAFRENTAGQGKWYVDYSLGGEGQCVQNCETGSFCGGPAENWDELFSTANMCCTQKLWWMPSTQCVPGLWSV